MEKTADAGNDQVSVAIHKTRLTSSDGDV